MGLENLKSIFNNISENDADLNDELPVAGIKTHINGDEYSGPISSDTFTTLNHVLQPDGTYQPYGKIPINASAQDSPMSKKLILSEAEPTINHWSGYENQQGVKIKDTGGIEKFYEGLIPGGGGGTASIRFRHNEGANIGKNNILGAKDGGLELKDIFDPSHGADSVGKIRPAGVGSTKYLDIRANQEGGRIGINNSREPYVVKSIPDTGRNTIKIGYGELLPFSATLDDIQRFGKFYTSGKGLASLLKENIINFATSDDKNDLLYNPFGWIMAPPIPVPMKGFLNAYHGFGQTLGRASIRKPRTGVYSVDLRNAFRLADQGDSPIETADKAKAGFEKRLEGLDDKTPKSVKKQLKAQFTKASNKLAELQFPLSSPFTDTKITSFISKADKSDPFSNAKSYPDDDDISLKEAKLGDSFVRIKDLRSGGGFIFFRGYVTGIVENLTPTFNPTQYIGRSEDVYIYQKAERDLSFNLKIYPANIAEFNAMYAKIEKLTSLAYPNYKKEDNDSTIMRMEAPFTELYMGHIGDRGRGQFGYIKSLTYTVPEGGDWDARTAMPRYFEISLAYQILNKKPPRMRGINTKFYGSFESYKQ